MPATKKKPARKTGGNTARKPDASALSPVADALFPPVGSDEPECLEDRASWEVIMRRLEKLRPADVPEYAAALSRRTGKPPLVALVEEWAKDEAYNALAWERLRKRLNEGRPPDRQITDE